MTASLPYMPIYWGDYLRDTGHLGAAQHGAYLLLIAHYWSHGEPLPDDDDALWRIARCDDIRQWRKMRPIIARFFDVADGVWRHGRVEAQLSDAREKHAKRSAAGKNGNTKRWSKPENDAYFSSQWDRNAIANGSQCDRNGIAGRSQPDPDLTTNRDPDNMMDRVVITTARAREEAQATADPVMTLRTAVWQECGWSDADPGKAGHIATVRMWLDRGYDPDADILPTIRRCVGAASGPIHSLRYFDTALAQAHAARVNPPAPRRQRNRPPSILEAAAASLGERHGR